MARKKKTFVQNDNHNAVAYCRFSSEAQREVSIEQQLTEIRRYCEVKGLHIIGEYADKAISGTVFDRPELQRMLNEVKVLRPAYLIVWKTDRLSRDRMDSIIIKQQLRDLGVKIDYVAEVMPEDEADRVLLEGISEALAEHYVIQHAKNVTRGLNYNAENALYNGRKLLGYKGRPNERYQIDSETAPIVQRIFQDYANGKPMKVICNEINSAGFRTVRGNLFTEKSLWHILHNRSYIGEYRWGDTVVENGLEPIISIELFDRVQDMMQANKHGGRGGAKKLNSTLDEIDFWLTGKIHCGLCGAPMSGASGTGKSGKLYYYYACNNHKKHACNLKNIRKDDIEAVVSNVLEECLRDNALVLEIANKVYEYYMREYGSDDSYEKSLRSSIKEIDIKLNNILKAIESGIFNTTTQDRMLELQKQKQLFEDELIAEENRQKYSLKPEHVIRYLRCFIGDVDKPLLRDKILSYLVENIYLYEDKVIINFYYSEDKRAIDLNEMNEYLQNKAKLMNMIDGFEGKDFPTKLNETIMSMLDEEDCNSF